MTLSDCKDLLPRIFKTLFAAFVVTLIAKLLAYIFQQLHGHQTAFDSAVSLMMHYPESFQTILSFLAVNFILLFVTVLIEPADIGVIARKWVVLPSMNAVEHMLSLGAGAYMASVLIESITVGISYGSVFKTLFAVFSVCGLTVLVAWMCAMSVMFMEIDYSDKIMKLGRFRLPALLSISTVALFMLYTDFVANFHMAVAHVMTDAAKPMQ